MQHDRIYLDPDTGLTWVGSLVFDGDSVYSSWQTLEGDAISWHRFPRTMHPSDIIKARP